MLNTGNLKGTIKPGQIGTPPVMQSKSVTPGTAQQVVLPDAGYSGLSDVTVAGIPVSAAINATITERDQVISIPAGYYSEIGTVQVGDKSAIQSVFIHRGKTILGVAGKYETVDTSLLSNVAAGASDIVQGKAAWVNGELINGTKTESAGHDDEILSGNWSDSSYTNTTVNQLLLGFPDTVSINASGMGSYALAGPRPGKYYTFPSLISINQFGFYQNSAVKSVTAPVATSVGDSAFRECTSLESVSLASCTTIGANAFYGCSQLSSVNLPLVRNLPSYSFRNCTSLASINIPKATSIVGAFYSCTNLETVDIGEDVTEISASTFQNCSNLTKLIIRATTPPTLARTNAFTGTPIASGTGYIYVPSASITAYQAETNWATYTAQFKALEDME